jgi:Uma2 family endonuclease
MPLAAIPLLPPLREGDRLRAREFLGRWDAMPELKHAELIDGIVFMASPVRHGHGDFHSRLDFWLGFYSDSTPGCRAGADATAILGDRDVPQPDIALRVLPEYGGQTRTSGEYVEGPPELVVEVSGSSTSRDLGIKLDLYRRSGVREYITIILKSRQVIWRELFGGRYKEIEPSEDGLLRSRVFPGLWLDPEAVWDFDRSLRPALEKGLESPEHAEFVRELAARRGPR